MHIEQIEIENFKSFADKTVIPFRRGFTTISGPNGSGKSNIIDSILFCLGLSTSRTMRAEKLTDLINNLSKRREAQVNITFGTLLPSGTSEAEAPSNEGEVATPPPQLTVGRRIKDGPNGYTSTYYLNGRPSTLTDIHEALSIHNISPGCYNVMMQGDVAGIVNMSPMERRKIIDEIAGVAEFDRKIEQAQKELETTGTNIERNTILLGEITTRLEQLATEREHALKYQTFRDQKLAAESKLLAARYFQLKAALQSATQNITSARKEKETAQTTLTTLIEQVTITRGALQELSEQVKRKGEDQQIAIKKQIEGLKGHIARKQDSMRFLDQQKVDGIKNIEKMEQEIARQQENIEAIDGEIANYEHQLKELQALYEKEAEAYEALNRQFDQMTESSGELSAQRAETREKLGLAEDELSRINREILNLEAEAQRFELDIDRFAQEQSQWTDQVAQLTERKTALSRSLEEAMAEKLRLEGQLKTTQLEYSQTRVQIQNAQGKFNQLNREYMQLDAQKKAYDEVHFGRAVETVLRSGIPGIHGTLAQLGSIDEEYALALEIAMGGRLQNIVVDDDQVAQECIELLQRAKAGRATLLPMNKIQRARSLPMAPRDKGVVDFAANLMEFDGQYEDVFAYALGDTLVVEDMASARRLLKQYRMVTLDGSLMEKSGAMSGGSAPSAGRGGARFANTKKVDDELNRVLKQLDAAEAEKNKLEKGLTQLELKLDGLKEQYAVAMTAANKLEVELDGINSQLESLAAKQASQEKGAVVSDLSAERTRRLNETRQQISALEKQATQQEPIVLQLRATLEQVEDRLPSDQLEALRKSISDVKFQRDHYDSQLRNVQAEIKGKQLEKSHQEQGIQHYHERIAQTKDSFGALEKEKAACQEEIQLTTLQIKELEAQTQELDEELKKLQGERDAVQSQLIELEKQKYDHERKLSLLDEQILSFQARKRELEPQLQTAKVELVRAGQNLDTLQESDLPSEEELTKQIQSLTRKMEAMEPVNMLAIKEYDEVSARQGELSEKIETLNREREAITVKIAGYHELKRLSFMKAFENVDQNFKTIFAELSDGEGQLILTNPDDPFSGGLTIQAQPRGKKMQRLEAMSGGEKSLTSLAFVFSLQRYMPAPFYALDEVDMNLDGINAEKLANMVKRESRTAQFIVVSLRKPMIEHSDRTVGVTQKRDGGSKVTGVKLREDHDEREASPEPAA